MYKNDFLEKCDLHLVLLSFHCALLSNNKTARLITKAVVQRADGQNNQCKARPFQTSCSVKATDITKPFQSLNTDRQTFQWKEKLDENITS